MQIVYILCILLLVALSFYAGKRIADSYNERTIAELQYQLRLNSAREGVGYVAPPIKRKVPIGQPFMDKLKTNGRATQQISSPKTI